MAKVLKATFLLLALVLLASAPAVISANTESSSGALGTTPQQVAPGVSATASADVQVRLNSPVSVTATFMKPVSGFTLSDITVGNGTASNLAGSDGDSVYTFDVTPNSLGEVTVDIAAGVATDGEGVGNTAAPRLSLGIPYDFDGNGGISRAEVIAAIRDYFGGNITRAQAIAVIRLYFFTPTEPGPGIGQSDRAVLITFYNATNGPNWANNSGWGTDAPLGQWYGVTTDDSGQVTELILNDNGLSGSIPAVLGNLSSLKVLNLANPSLSCRRSSEQRWVCTSSLPAPNRLTGAIPADLARLANLEQLMLNGNQLSGTIPAWLGNLSKLERLSLKGNQLTGTIPADLARLTNLRLLTLSFNPIDENMPLPTWLTSLSHLTHIELTGLDLTGTVPPGLSSLSNLNIVGLFGNQLTGEIPPQLGQLTRLRSLDLGNNSLTGPIPPELGSISTLRRLNLGGNRLSGSIPSELGNLSNLRTLRLVGNNLSGCVPSALQNVPTNDVDRLGLPFCAP